MRLEGSSPRGMWENGEQRKWENEGEDQRRDAWEGGARSRWRSSEEMMSGVKGNMARGSAASSACQTDGRTDDCWGMTDTLITTNYCNSKRSIKICFTLFTCFHNLILFLLPSGSLDAWQSGREKWKTNTSHSENRHSGIDIKTCALAGATLMETKSLVMICSHKWRTTRSPSAQLFFSRSWPWPELSEDPP